MTSSQRRSPIGLNPLYAVLGATDLAAQKLREIGATATGESTPTDSSGTTRADLRRLVIGARQVPAIALNEALDVVVRTQSQFSDLAERGERVLKRQPRVQQTEELLDRAGKTVARGQAAASRAAHTAADRTRDRATSAVTSAREQADEVVEAVSHFGRSSTPSTLLRRGSVARPVRPAQGGAAQDAPAARPKPRRPRVSPATGRATGAPATDDEGRSRHGIPSSSGVEAGATVTTAKKSGSKAAAQPAAGTSAVATRRAATAGKSAKSAKSVKAVKPVKAVKAVKAVKSPVKATATGPASKPASATTSAPRRRAAASSTSASATAPASATAASADTAPATPAAPAQEA